MEYVKNYYSDEQIVNWLINDYKSFQPQNHDCKLSNIEFVDADYDFSIIWELVNNEIDYHEACRKVIMVYDRFSKSEKDFRWLQDDQIGKLREIFSIMNIEELKKQTAKFYHDSFQYFASHKEKILVKEKINLFKCFWIFVLFSNYNKKKIKLCSNELDELWKFMAEYSITPGGMKVTEFVDASMKNEVVSYYRSRLWRNIKAINDLSPDVVNLDESIIYLLKQLDDDDAISYFNKYLNTFSVERDLTYQNYALEKLKKGLIDLPWFSNNDAKVPYEERVKEINNGLDPKNLGSIPGQPFVNQGKKAGFELANGLAHDVKFRGNAFSTAAEKDGRYEGTISVRADNIPKDPLADIITNSDSFTTSLKYSLNRLLGESAFQSVIALWSPNEKLKILEIYKKRINAILAYIGYDKNSVRFNEYSVVFETYVRNMLTNNISPCDANINLHFIETSISLIEMLLTDLNKYFVDKKSTYGIPYKNGQHLKKADLINKWLDSGVFPLMSHQTLLEINEMLFLNDSKNPADLGIRNNIVHKESGFLVMISYQSLVTYLLMEMIDELFGNIMLEKSRE